MTETLDLARRADFTIGETEIRPSLRTITGNAGTATAEPRVMQVFLALFDAHGAVLSREDLLELCWGGVVVGDDAINRTIAELRRIARETGADITIETIPRVGYRLAGDAIQTAAETPGKGSLSRRSLMLLAGAGAVATVGGAALAYLRTRPSPADELIRRGIDLQSTRGPAAFPEAAKLFRQATELEPQRAEAWGWLARMLPEDLKARETALHALSLDEREPNARAVLVTQSRDLEDWVKWEDELLEIIEDDPYNTLALSYITLFYQGVGRCTDSWNLNERIFKAEPFNPAGLHRRALKHWLFGRNAEADKIVDQALRMWPRAPMIWNARLIIYAFTDRPRAALALLDDEANRPPSLTQASVDAWRAALVALETRARADIARAVEVYSSVAGLAPGLAANALMVFSTLGELDASYRVADGLFEGRGPLVLKVRGEGIKDLYSDPAWGRTQFVFTPACVAFRNDARFSGLCDRIGLTHYWQERGIWPDPFVRGVIETP